jgi:predicted permease
MIRFAARRLLRSPAFTLGVTVLLAWGIGSGTALLSLVDAISFRSLEAQHPDELVRVVQHDPAFRTETEFPRAFFEALQARDEEFSAIAGELEAQAVLSEPAPAQEIRASFVTAQFFSLLGVPALYGRVLTPSDDSDASVTSPAVLSYAFWNTRFHRDRRVLGQSILFNNHPFVIVGVMPRSFHGFSADTTSGVWMPSNTFGLVLAKNGRPAPPWLSIMARLKPGVTRAAAEPAALAIWQQAITQYWTGRLQENGQLARDNLAEDLRLGVQLESEKRGNSVLRDRYGEGWVLLGGSALVLEILLCANLATIVVSRNAANTNDIAVRLALGASRGQVLRLLLCESALLAAAGTIAGIIVGYLLIPLLVFALPPVRNIGTDLLTTAIEVGRDLRPLVIGLVLGMGSTLSFGCAPAWIASRRLVREGLQSGHVSHKLGAQRRLLLLQVALCTLLLACASLLARSFVHLRGTDPGFAPEHLVSFSFNPDLRGYTDDQANRLRERLMARVQALPGVGSVAEARFPLMRGTGIKLVFAPQGVTIPAKAPLNVTLDPVSDSFFSTMGMKIIEGRNLPQNQEHGPGKVAYVVVNQALARLFFPGVNPLGRRFGSRGSQDAYEVVGVVSDAKFRSLREVPPPTVYVDAANLGRFSSVLYLRTRLRAETLIEPVLEIFAALDPTLPVTDVATMEEELDATTAGERFNARIASAFALFAAILAGLGIYGLMALVVTQRRRELAVHLAVGAPRSRVVALVSRQFLFAVAGGIVAGLGAAWFVTPLLRSMLYDISPNDPASLLTPLCAVALIALLGSLGPLLRTLSIEPATALRQVD